MRIYDYHNRCSVVSVVHGSTRLCVREDNHTGKHMFWATGGDQWEWSEA